MKKVFREQAPRSRRKNGDDVSKGILSFFPGFEAFALSPPSTDQNVLGNLNTKKDQLQPQFLRELEQFKKMMKSILVPKQSFTEGELVTGEGLATLVTEHVHAINTPGVVPNVQVAWESFVQTKCSATIKLCQKKYNDLMAIKLPCEQLPCNNAKISLCHNIALEETEHLLMTEMTGISITTVERQLKQLKSFFNKRLTEWMTENSWLTRKFCDDLLLKLKTKHLDPVIERLRGREGSKLSFDEILNVYRRIKDDYKANAVGAEGAIAVAFYDFHPILAADTKHYFDKLKQLEDFDESTAREIVAEAFTERERRRLEDDSSGLQQENQTMKKEMLMLIARSENERAALLEQREETMKKEREQLQNMKQAGLIEAQQQRETFIKENQVLGERLLGVRNENEEQMKMIKSMSEMIAEHQREKMQLLKQMKTSTYEEVKDSMEELDRRQSEEVNALLMKVEARLADIKSVSREDLNATTKDDEYFEAVEDLPDMMTSRAQIARDLHQRLAENERDQRDLRAGEILKRVLKFIEDVAPQVGAAAALYPTFSSYAMPVATAVQTIARGLQSFDCSIL